ncbi:hypothetical protein QYE76_057994 [Lolium multiflorum]|uniref:CCHC-type domain-containing protein n=1 Tax=Lolium multiflorum TaxID=4521 RepID=A0AAD8WS17_LOLMU|nr:hypothetical protein QYE76_057994 [Lolium multiflorum]
MDYITAGDIPRLRYPRSSHERRPTTADDKKRRRRRNLEGDDYQYNGGGYEDYEYAYYTPSFAATPCISNGPTKIINGIITCLFFTFPSPSPSPSASSMKEKFEKVDAMFKAALFSILGDNIVDPYMAFDHGKDAWDALEAKFGVSDAGTELYVMEQYYDYRMTDERSVVEQAHEIQSLAKELEQFKCTLPDKFVAGGIIAKLPPSWRNFATSLKHKRQEFSVSDLIGSLHVEEKARAKDTRARSFEGGSSANVVQKKNFQSHKSKNKNNGKGKFDEKNKASNSTNFKKKTPYKKKGNCHVCGAPGHWAPDCPERHDRRGNSGKSANVVIGVDTEMKDVGYGCKDLLRADGKRLTCFCSWCWYGGSEVYFGKDHPAEECAARSLY